MRFVVVVVCALGLTGCGGCSVGVDSAYGARKVPILAAAMDCELAELRRLIPASRDAKDEQGQTALHWAVIRGCVEGVSVLMKAGADPHAEWPVLSSSAMMRNLELVQTLVEHGARVNHSDSSGFTALHMAAGSGDIAVVKYLLENGADVRAKNGSGFTALHSGAPYEDVVRALIAAGADVHARTVVGQTPLMSAPFWKYYQDNSGVGGVRALLAAGADARVVDYSGFTALMEAARKFDTESAQELLSAGVDVNARTKHGETALRTFRREAKQSMGWSNFLWRMLDSNYGRATESRDAMEKLLAASRATD